MLHDSGSTAHGGQPILSVRNLVIDAVSDEGRERIVDHVSFDVRAGSVFGIVGESGSGKTLTMLAVMGLLPSNLRVAGGEVWLEGENLLTLSAEEPDLHRREIVRVVSALHKWRCHASTCNACLRVAMHTARKEAQHQREYSRTFINHRVVLH